MTGTRVVQWATGATGRLALGAIIDVGGLDLVGVRVYDPAKVGLDAGALANRAPSGVLATDTTAEVLALEPDVVLYMGAVERHADQCFADVIELLGAGIDVVATGSSFIDPRALDPELASKMESACRTGSSTFLGLGLFPGFWGETIAPALSRLSLQCRNIGVRERLSYAGYPSGALLFDVMGFGRPPDSTEPVLSDPSRAAAAFAGTATVLAKAIGLEVKAIHPFRETAVTDVDLLVASGAIPAGTVAAMKLGVRADCGAVSMLVEHVTWMDPNVMPDWARSEGYELEFDGAPTMRCHLTLGTNGEDHSEMGCLATAMHAVHAIPSVHSAAPGLLTLADIASFTGVFDG